MQLKSLTSIVLSALLTGCFVSTTMAETTAPKGIIESPGTQTGQVKPPKTVRTNAADNSPASTSTSSNIESWSHYKLTLSESSALVKVLEAAGPITPIDPTSKKLYDNIINTMKAGDRLGESTVTNKGAISALFLVAEQPSSYSRAVETALTQMSPEESVAFEKLVKVDFSPSRLKGIMQDISNERNSLNQELNPMAEDRYNHKKALTSSLDQIDKLGQTLTSSLDDIKDQGLKDKLSSFTDEMTQYIKDADLSSQENKYSRSDITKFEYSSDITRLQTAVDVSDLDPTEKANIRNILENYSAATNDAYGALVDLGKDNLAMRSLVSQEKGLKDIGNQLATTDESYDKLSPLSEAMMSVNYDLVKFKDDPSKVSELTAVQEHNKKLAGLNEQLQSNPLNSDASKSTIGDEYNQFTKELQSVINDSAMGPSESAGGMSNINEFDTRLSAVVDDQVTLSREINAKQSPPSGWRDRLSAKFTSLLDSVRSSVGWKTSDERFVERVRSILETSKKTLDEITSDANPTDPTEGTTIGIEPKADPVSGVHTPDVGTLSGEHTPEETGKSAGPTTEPKPREPTIEPHPIEE